MADRTAHDGRGAALHAAGPTQVALWLIVVLLAVNAAILLVQPGAAARGQSGPIGQPAPGLGQDSLAGVFVVPGQLGKDLWGAYVIDSRVGTVVLYQYNPNTRKLELAAARSMVYDRYLENYNTKPSPEEIAELIAQAKRIRPKAGPGGPETPPAPPLVPPAGQGGSGEP